MKKKILSSLVVVVLALAVGWFQQPGPDTENASNQKTPRGSQQKSDTQGGFVELHHAVANKQSNVVVEGVGEVIKALPDDTKGSKHQRILVRLPTNTTLLIAHNIDLAPRVPNLTPGSSISFKGEYEYNDKGGVLHWTHHDPKNWHEAGWIEYQKQRYQ